MVIRTIVLDNLNKKFSSLSHSLTETENNDHEGLRQSNYCKNKENQKPNILSLSFSLSLSEQK